MLLPAKQRIYPNAHPGLCLVTIPPGGRSGGWDRSIWEGRIPSGTRGGPRRGRVPVVRGSRRREALPRGGRRGHARRAAAAYRPDPKCPGCGARGAWRDGSTADGGFKVALPLLRQEVHLPHRHRPRTPPKAAPRLDLLHQAHAPQRSRRVCDRAVRRHPQDRLRLAAPCARHDIRLPRPVRLPLQGQPGTTDEIRLQGWCAIS